MKMIRPQKSSERSKILFGAAWAHRKSQCDLVYCVNKKFNPNRSYSIPFQNHTQRWNLSGLGSHVAETRSDETSLQVTECQDAYAKLFFASVPGVPAINRWTSVHPYIAWSILLAEMMDVGAISFFRCI